MKKRFGFEETTYLLLFGELPTKDQLGIYGNSCKEPQIADELCA